MAKIAAMQTSLVGNGADDRAGPDLVPLADGDAVGGEPFFGLLYGFGGTIPALFWPALGRRGDFAPSF